MNIHTNPPVRRGAVRVFSWLMALALVFSLAIAPGASAFADTDAYSAELVLSAGDLSASCKIALDPGSMLLGAAAGMTIGDTPLADAAAYLSAQAAAVDGSLVGGPYGVDLTALAKNLPESIFAPGSGSYYALDEDTYNQVMLLLNGWMTQSSQNLNTKSDKTLKVIEDAMSVLSTVYTSDLLEEIVACLTVESSTASVVIDGKPMQVLEGRCTVDGKAVADILGVLVTPLQDSAEAQEALAVLIDEIAAASEEDFGASGAEIVEQIVSELPGLLPELEEELNSEGFSVSLVVCTTPDGLSPVKFALEIRSEDEFAALNLLMNEDADFFRLELVEDGETITAFQLAIRENSDSALTFDISVQSDGEEVSLTFDLNKSGKAFLLTLSADGESHSLSGFYNATDTLLSVTVDRLDGQEFGGTVTLNLRSDDTLALPSFTELTALSEEELDALMETLEENIEALADMFG